MPVISTIAAATARAFGAFKSAAGGAADEFFKYVTLLLHGDGTNGAQNNTFLDSSTNNFTITRNGNTTQGTFSPFSQTGWSNYFDGSGDYLQLASNSAFNMNTYCCLETWVCYSTIGTDTLIVGRDSSYWLGYNFPSIGGTANKFVFGINNGSSWQAVSSTTTPVVGVWYHVVGIKDNTTLRIYINGIQENTSTFSGTPTTPANVMGIGANQNTQNMAGYLSNTRLVLGASSTVLPYTGNFTPPTSALTAVSGTALLTCQSNRFRDASSNNFAITRNGDVSVQAFSPFAPTAAYSAATVGGSGYFDGSGDYLTVANNAALYFGTGDFTIECWVRTSSTIAYQTIASVYGSPDANYGWYFALGSTGAGIYFVVGGGSSTSVLEAGSGINDGAWHHVAAVRTGTTLSTYIDGARVATTTNSFNVTATSEFRMSGYPTVGSARDWNGNISGFRIIKGSGPYNATQTTLTVPTAPLTAITNTSLLLNFTNAGIIDNTAKNVLETVGNAQISTSVKKYGTGSLAFDGSGDYLKGVGNNPNLNFGSGNFTIEFWMYTADVTPSVAAWFVAMFNSNSGQNSWGVRLETSGALVMYLSSDGGESPTTISAASPALSDSTWHHIAVVRNGSGSNNITIYVDGVSKATGTFSSALFNSNQPVTIGIQGNTSFNQYFNGYIDDLRITKGVARYTTTFTPPTAAFADQ